MATKGYPMGNKSKGKVAGGGTMKALPTQDSPLFRGNNKKVIKKGPSGAGNGSGMGY